MKTTNAKTVRKYGFTAAEQAFLIRIGQNLKSLRISKNIEAAAVCASCKISLNRLQKIESGEQDVKLDLFVKLCNYYEVDARTVLPTNDSVT